MTAIAATTDSATTKLADLAELLPCASCGAPLAEPQTSNYLGLGHIEHIWHCAKCGAKSRTSARLAGIVDVPTLADEASTA